MNLRGLAIGALAVVLLTGCGGSGEPGAGEGRATGKYTPSPSGALAASRQRFDDAYAFCIDRITEKLKAPATARFSERDRDHEAQDGDRYLFTGTVDSENGFGALLRSEWACDIRWTGSGFVADAATIT